MTNQDMNSDVDQILDSVLAVIDNALSDEDVER
jgi:hypothetical protein